MRATTGFNRLLALDGARVGDALFVGAGTTVRVALTRRLAACSACGHVCRQVHDRGWRRWRYLKPGRDGQAADLPAAHDR